MNNMDRGSTKQRLARSPFATPDQSPSQHKVFSSFLQDGAKFINLLQKYGSFFGASSSFIGKKDEAVFATLPVALSKFKSSTQAVVDQSCLEGTKNHISSFLCAFIFITLSLFLLLSPSSTSCIFFFLHCLFLSLFLPCTCNLHLRS